MPSEVMRQAMSGVAKNPNLAKEWANVAGAMAKNLFGGAASFAIKHPWATMTAATAVPVALAVSPFFDQVYTFHLMHKQNKYAKEQNKRLANIQMLNQMQIDQSINPGSFNPRKSLGPYLETRPLT